MADDFDGGGPDLGSMPRALKAYLNPKFLKSRDARMLRIMSEYLEPLQRFNRKNVRETVVMFGSARARPPAKVKAELKKARASKQKGQKGKAGRDNIARLESQLLLARYYDDAVELSAMITKWAKSLNQGNRFVICSGGGPGIMEAANRGASEKAGGITAGLAISLPNEERPNPYITPELLFEFHYFFMRKLWFVYLASGLVVFPGGFGTMDEFFEVLTLVQTRKVDRPLPIILYGKKFWNDFMNLDSLVKWGTISPGDPDLFKVCDSPKEAFEYMKKELLRHYPVAPRWGSSTGGTRQRKKKKSR